MFANVSTLLSTVGQPHNPFIADDGGLGVGMPRLPSIERISADDSPHTKAPAPWYISISKLNPVPRILLPSRPYSLACSIASCSLCTASGYSALTYMPPLLAPIALAPMSIPSRTTWGSPSIMLLSMNAPGSPSSPLQRIHFWSALTFALTSHFTPVGNPAPPLPLSP